MIPPLTAPGPQTTPSPGVPPGPAHDRPHGGERHPYSPGVEAAMAVIARGSEEILVAEELQAKLARA